MYNIMICLCMIFYSIAITAHDSFIVDSFEDSHIQSVCGGWWYTYNDSINGGNSIVLPLPGRYELKKTGYDKKGYSAYMKGVAGNKLGWDYVGMGVTLSAASGCPESKPVDMIEYKNIQFKMKGKFCGGRLILLLPYTENRCDSGANSQATLTEWADYEAPLTGKIKPDWVSVSLDLRKDFHQPRWAKQNIIVPIDTVLKNLKNINFQYSSPDGDSIEIWIDEIRFTR